VIKERKQKIYSLDTPRVRQKKNGRNVSRERWKLHMYGYSCSLYSFKKILLSGSGTADGRGRFEDMASRWKVDANILNKYGVEDNRKGCRNWA
jgi:hypothetical protein